jgi:FeS assembly SUF system protein
MSEPETLPVQDIEEIEAGVVEALKTVFDPEIPVNIYELGLVYDVDVAEDGEVKIKMTLTSPACPVAGSLPGEVQAKVEKVPGVRRAEIELAWEPAWNPSMMTDAARLQLGMF